jgi:hypothetical protein
LKSEEKNQTQLPREFDNYPESPLWGKLLLLLDSALGVQQVAFLRIELLPSWGGSWWRKSPVLGKEVIKSKYQ